MLLRQMKYFAAVADCNCFTWAAEQCYISQSAISQQIQALEQELGVALLCRQGRRFTLTPAGEYFHTHCKVILGQTDELIRQTRRLGSDGGRQLRIGYPRSYSGLELHQARSGICRLRPDITIDIVNGTHEELYNLLRTGGADLVLNDQRRAFSDAYVNLELVQCACLVELAARHPLSGRDRIGLEELWQTPCILISPQEERGAEQNTIKPPWALAAAISLPTVWRRDGCWPSAAGDFCRWTAWAPCRRRGPVCGACPWSRAGGRSPAATAPFWRRERSDDAIEPFALLLRRLLAPDRS